VNGLRSLWREHWLTLTLIAAMAIAYLVLRTPSEGLDEAAFWQQVEAADAAVVYFYSNT
jgi:hypothetical protein